MALKFFWRCEGTTLDGTHDFTSGDNIATLNSQAAINTAAVRIGTNGLDCPSTSDAAEFTVSSQNLISGSQGALAFSFRITTFAADASMFHAFDGAEANNRILLQMIGTNDATGRELQLRIGVAFGDDVTLATTAADLQLNTWYAVVCRWHSSNQDTRIEVYNENGTLRTSVEALADNFGAPNTITLMGIGETMLVNADVHYDNVFVADTYSEALEDNLDITSYTEYGGGGPAAETLMGQICT